MQKKIHFSQNTKYWLTTYLYIAFPLIYSVLLENENHLIKRIIYTSIAAFGLCLPFTLIKKQFHKWLLALYLPIYILYWLEICHIHIFDIKLIPPSILIILDSNITEATQFTTNVFNLKILLSTLLCGIVITLCWYFIKKYHSVDTKLNKKLIAITLCSLIFSISKGFHDTNFNRYQLLPYRFFHTAYNYHQEKSNLIKLQKEHKIPHIKGLTSKNDKSLKETYIIVIGESADKNHLAYYGYKRNTTPFSSSAIKPLVFKNVETAHASTLLALRDLLTFSNKHNKNGLKQGSLINIFNQAGFKSYWLSNQYSQGQYDNLTSVLAHDADNPVFINDNHQYFINNSTDSHFDEQLLPLVDNALQDPNTKKIIFVHLIGSHTPYELRFPEKFDIYKEHDQNSFEKEFDDYDNSIRYTDYILSKITQKIASLKEQAFVLYVSDHGDDVRLTPDSCHCHTMNLQKQTPQMYEIPFLLWFNSTYQKNNPQLVKQIKSYTERPFITHHLIHSLPTLAGLSFDLQDNEKNLFSPSFVPEKE